MSFDVHVRRAAELDVAEAQIWYEAQRSGLGVEFHSEVSRSLTDLLRLLSFTKSHIEMFGGRLFIGSRSSFGTESLANWLRSWHARTADKIQARRSLVFNKWAAADITEQERASDTLRAIILIL